MKGELKEHNLEPLFTQSVIIVVIWLINCYKPPKVSMFSKQKTVLIKIYKYGSLIH
jgi:hypothetical protein